jgi:hypothetical protein
VSLSGRNLRNIGEHRVAMRPDLDERPNLELALLRRGMHERDAGRDRCHACRRTPLIGERMYAYDDGRVLCELCRALSDHPPARSRVIHGPEFGHTMKIADRRASAA